MTATTSSRRPPERRYVPLKIRRNPFMEQVNVGLFIVYGLLAFQGFKVWSLVALVLVRAWQDTHG